MKSEASLNNTVVSVDLNIRTIELAEKLGLDLSKMANRLLKIEVNKRLRKIKDGGGKPEGPV